ncbi:putative methyltransferase PMT26-like, partial [Trifolium medium]|nr:putative methyltransferase PMT26-like [Trifolium medium]
SKLSEKFHHLISYNMAQAKYTRIDNKRSSTSYCSTVTIVVFVALCLVGLWMMTSSVVPVQNVDDSQETKSEVKEQSEQSQVKEQPTDTTNSDTTNSDTTNSNAQQF